VRRWCERCGRRFSSVRPRLWCRDCLALVECRKSAVSEFIRLGGYDDTARYARKTPRTYRFGDDYDDNDGL
jgi:hypothetical protein